MQKVHSTWAAFIDCTWAHRCRRLVNRSFTSASWRKMLKMDETSGKTMQHLSQLENVIGLPWTHGACLLT